MENSVTSKAGTYGQYHKADHQKLVVLGSIDFPKNLYFEK